MPSAVASARSTPVYTVARSAGRSATRPRANSAGGRWASRESADALNKDIDRVGHVAVYEILFDTAKADLKPESDAALVKQ